MAAAPLTLAHWRSLWQTDAPLRVVLQSLRERLLRESPGEAWITRVDARQLDAQIDSLEIHAAGYGERAAALRALPLFGVPFAVKDNIDVAGLPTTAACPAFAYQPMRHAHAVGRLLEAGAICFGKTNLDQFATGLTGARSPYGRPSSAFAAERVSGGSSSGSAVVVARGDVAFALGTDTAGSGRVPAGFNNLVGLKPTPGRVGGSGVVPACRSLDCISVLALTVADAAAVLAVIEGPDANDAYSGFQLGAAALGSTLRIAIPTAPVFSGDAGYARCFEQAVEHANALGHRVSAIDFEPLFAVARLLYDGPWVAERHAVVEALLAADPGAIDPDVRQVIAAACRFSATDAFRAQYALRDAVRDQAGLWDRFDLLMVPTAPGHPTHAEIDADPLGANAQLGTYTNFVNLLGWCALALPAGFTASGLPFGVTFIAPGAADAALARFGERWEMSLELPLGATGRAPDTDPPDADPPDLDRLGVDRLGVDRLGVDPPGVDPPGVDSTGVDPPAAPIDAGARPWPASRPTVAIAVVGAHLSGMPLNHQLVERGATLRNATRTAPCYRLFALPGTTPPKPGLQRVLGGGASIAVEVWDIPLAEVGSFLALIPAPLGLGSIELLDGRRVHGFICEGHALGNARDITEFGGWRAFVAAS